MTTLFLPGGPAGQLANLSFLLAALFSDILLVRLWLVVAYLWLLTSAALGLPKWPAAAPPGGLALDTLLWAVLCLCFHGLSLLRLLWDERPVRFASSQQVQLWRFFMRRSGMGRLEMKQVLNYGGWQRVPAGQPIVCGGTSRMRFYVLVEGLATLNKRYRGVLSEPQLLYSGSCFDMGLLNIFGIYVSMEKIEGHILSVTALTDCLLYSWTTDELSLMATQLAPAVGAHWRYFSLCQLGMLFAYRSHPAERLLCAMGEPEPESVLAGGRSRDFDDELRPYEQQQHTVVGILRWMRHSLHPFPPAGLRHNALPTTGIMARNRLIAQKAAAIEQEQAPQEQGTGSLGAAGAARGSGRRLLRILEQMRALQSLESAALDKLVADMEAGSDAESGHTELRPGTATSSGSSSRRGSVHGQGAASASRLCSGTAMACQLPGLAHPPTAGEAEERQGGFGYRASGGMASSVVH